MSFARLLFATTLMGLAAAATGQQVFRIVGPDGKVTFSDKPPETSAKATAAPAVALPGGGGAALPFELRQIASKYPVTLYTGTNCAPCGAGKAYLTSRGVPFAEKTVSTNEDLEALQRLAGDNSLPLLTVGGQQIKGYSDAEWGQFLDAAGYPKTSQLPPGYRSPPAAPLVAVQRPAAASPQAGGAAGAQQGTQGAQGAQQPETTNRRFGGAGRAATPAPAPAPANPAGITF